jgi:hypothetical protein
MPAQDLTCHGCTGVFAERDLVELDDARDRTCEMRTPKRSA